MDLDEAMRLFGGSREFENRYLVGDLEREPFKKVSGGCYEKRKVLAE